MLRRHLSSWPTERWAFDVVLLYIQKSNTKSRFSPDRIYHLTPLRQSSSYYVQAFQKFETFKLGSATFVLACRVSTFNRSWPHRPTDRQMGISVANKGLGLHSLSAFLWIGSAT